MILSEYDLKDLAYAKKLLEHPSFAARIMNAVGMPIEAGLRLLPENVSLQVHKISEKTIKAVFQFALMTMGDKAVQLPSADTFHKIIATATGFAGGFFGLPALGIELPISTSIIIRSIADIARSEGENIRAVESKLACVEVFALGGRTEKEGELDTGYFAVRAALSQAVSEALEYVAERGVAEAGAPLLVRLIAQIASRFGIVVSEKIAASAIPIIGAAGGAMINMIFIDHFQDIARGHFIVRRLERQYGKESVKIEYERI